MPGAGGRMAGAGETAVPPVGGGVVSSHYTPYCMQRRDRYMVDHAALVIAVFDGTSGGTRYTIDYAIKKGVPIADLPVN